MRNLDIASLGLFAGNEHQPFMWEGGQPAALLIHGFLGTPAEMRPLAHELHRAGWTVQGLLLPGFGEQLHTLFDRRYQEWLEEVRSAVGEPAAEAGYRGDSAIAKPNGADDPAGDIDVPIYDVDYVVRRADALQLTQEARRARGDDR